MEELNFYLDPIGSGGVDDVADQANLTVKVGDKGYQVGGGVVEPELLVEFLEFMGDANPMEETNFHIDTIGFGGVDDVAEQANLPVTVGDQEYQVGGGILKQESVKVLDPRGVRNPMDEHEFDGEFHITESAKSGGTPFIASDVDLVDKHMVGMVGDRQVGGVLETDDDDVGVFVKEPVEFLDSRGDVCCGVNLCLMGYPKMGRCGFERLVEDGWIKLNRSLVGTVFDRGRRRLLPMLDPPVVRNRRGVSNVRFKNYSVCGLETLKLLPRVDRTRRGVSHVRLTISLE